MNFSFNLVYLKLICYFLRIYIIYHTGWPIKIVHSGLGLMQLFEVKYVTHSGGPISP